MIKYTKYLNIFFLSVVILSGIFILHPNLNFQEQISQGDHGRDLYSFQQTYKGAKPYKNYKTQNGPLMPYYYTLIFKITGANIQGTLLGYNFLILLTGIFIYLSCSIFLSQITSLLCALWYWTFRGTEFFYTYNHIGAIFLISVTIFIFFKYIKENKKFYISLGSFVILLTILIRPDIGIASFVAFFISAILYNYSIKKSHRIYSLIFLIINAGISLLLAFILYKFFLNNAPHKAITSDIAYWKYIRLTAPLKNIFLLARITFDFIKVDLLRIIFSILVLFCAVVSLKHLLKPNKKTSNKIFGTALIFLSILTILVLFEFFLGDRWFRYRWVFCPMFILIFFIIEDGMTNFSALTKNIIKTFIFISILTTAVTSYKFINFSKTQNVILNINDNKVYLSPDQKQWLQTVSKTTYFIQSHVPKKEKILAMPYDPLYYFLSRRKSAFRELDISNKFFENNIEKRPDINYIIASNRFHHTVDSINFKKYGFKLVAIFGPWDKETGWTTNHAVKIYKRIKAQNKNDKK